MTNEEIKELKKYERDGLITIRPHNTLPLRILNYTPTVQYDRLWTPLLKQCRGLVVDNDWNVVARSMEKFFNYEEHLEFDSLPDINWDEAHDVWTKLDGSLGIIFWYKGEWRVATRGSFTSDQAQKATEMLENYETQKLDKDYTYLVEIIYPKNRIVINYEGREELILVATIRTEDGAEPFGLKDDVFPTAQKHLLTLKSIIEHKDKFDDGNTEGFVIHFASSLRIKIKLDEYVRLHRLLTGLNKRSIWELLRDGDDVEKLYQTAPDEVYGWVEESVNEILTDAAILYKTSYDLFDELYDEGIERKEFAQRVYGNDEVLEMGLQSVMFQLLDGREIDDFVWKLVYPDHEPLDTTQS